jgi:hypothetical protein
MWHLALDKDALRSLQVDPGGDLPKPHLPHQAQTQGLQNDVDLHDLGVPHLGRRSQQGTRRKRRKTIPRGERHRDGF